MTIPVAAVVADLRSGKGIPNPGEATVNNIGFKNGAQVPSLVQTIPANPTGDTSENKWTFVEWTDPDLGITKATLFRLWPGKCDFEHELYGAFPGRVPGFMKTRWTRVYYDGRSNDSTAERGVLLDPQSHRFSDVNMSKTGITGSGDTTEFVMGLQVWARSLDDWQLDTRIFKPTTVLKLVAARIDIG